MRVLGERYRLAASDAHTLREGGQRGLPAKATSLALRGAVTLLATLLALTLRACPA